jgi:hypothetical protein
VTEQELIRTIQELVAAGEYLDTIPGIPGAALTGGGMFQGGRRLYRRGSPEHLEARAAGLVDRLPPLQVAAPDAVEEAESLLGRRLPSALRRLYLEVGNGDPGKALFRQDRNVTEWLARWVDGRLHQPWAVQDPSTGQWRGATDQECEEGMPEE